jgi:hypothetical protein
MSRLTVMSSASIVAKARMMFFNIGFLLSIAENYAQQQIVIGITHTYSLEPRLQYLPKATHR